MHIFFYIHLNFCFELIVFQILCFVFVISFSRFLTVDIPIILFSQTGTMLNVRWKTLYTIHFFQVYLFRKIIHLEGGVIFWFFFQIRFLFYVYQHMKRQYNYSLPFHVRPSTDWSDEDCFNYIFFPKLFPSCVKCQVPLTEPAKWGWPFNLAHEYW